jgi:hypothetical protein
MNQDSENIILKHVDLRRSSYFNFFTGRNEPSKTCGIPHVDSFELLSEKFCSKSKKKVSATTCSSNTPHLNDKWLDFDSIENLVIPSVQREKDDGAMKAGKVD